MMAPILPGSTIGVFGSGQLGRMMAVAAKQMGYCFHTFSPEPDSPAGQVADHECVAGYDDTEAVESFVRGVDVVTFEFENVDPAVADIAVELGVPVHPGGWVLRTAQNRIREKSVLRDAGLPVTPFAPVERQSDLTGAAAMLGFPIVLKTASSGYDGKGQIVAADGPALRMAWDELGRVPAVAERWAEFLMECSVVAARNAEGGVADYGAIENVHSDHILDLSISPARLPAGVAEEAVRLAHAVLDALDVVGVTCVEFFVTGGALLINEIAPRPHNSGHLTIEAAATSQFEQHVRAICGLPLGSTHRPKPAAMANLLGDLWQQGEPEWPAALAHPGVKLHLYGKAEARPGRKMGHLTAVAQSVDAAIEAVLSARQVLSKTIATKGAVRAGVHGSLNHVPTG